MFFRLFLFREKKTKIFAFSRANVMRKMQNFRRTFLFRKKFLRETLHPALIFIPTLSHYHKNKLSHKMELTLLIQDMSQTFHIHS